MNNAMLQGVALSAGIAAVVGAAGAFGVSILARRRTVVAAVLAPLVVVVAVAAGVYASVRAMFLSSQDSTTVLLLLAAAVPVALGVGLVLALRVWRMAASAATVEAARQRDREIEENRREMVAWVSHDLRTPLAAVHVLTEALEDGVGERRETIRRIQAATRRMSGMVDDLLALSRLQSPSVVLHQQEVDLRDLVSDAVATVRALADARQVTVVESQGVRAARVSRSTQSSAAVVGQAAIAVLDAQEVFRAVENLLINAVRHTPPDGTVTVTVQAREGNAVVAVQDECGGIPEDDLARVFDAGWRGTRARTPTHEGFDNDGDGETGYSAGLRVGADLEVSTVLDKNSDGVSHALNGGQELLSGGAGLGLAIVRGVAEAHGGQAAIRNVSGGCRAELRVPLPSNMDTR